MYELELKKKEKRNQGHVRGIVEDELDSVHSGSIEAVLKKTSKYIYKYFRSCSLAGDAFDPPLWKIPNKALSLSLSLSRCLSLSLALSLSRFLALSPSLSLLLSRSLALSQ